MKIILRAFVFGAIPVAGCLLSCERKVGRADSVALDDASIHAVGYIEPRGELRRLAFQREGVIVTLTRDVGEKVKAGEAIARLDDLSERMRLASAEANLELTQAKRDLVLAGTHPDTIQAAKESLRLASLELAHREKQRARYGNLRDKRGISEMDSEEADFDAEASAAAMGEAEAKLAYLMDPVRPEDRVMLDAEVAVARAEVESARANLEKMTLKAPVDGMIAEIFLREGEAVSTMDGEPVVLLAPAGRLEVRAEVDESFAGKMKTGALASIESPGTDGEIAGTVRQIKPVMGRKSVFSRSASERMDLQVFEVRIELAEDPDWPIGFEVEIEIAAGQAPLVSAK